MPSENHRSLTRFLPSMLFISPMWDNEAERIGKQKCTPVGYTLHGISDLMGLAALLLLLGGGPYLAYRAITGTFHASLFLFMPLPFGIAMIAAVLYRFSWRLAYQKGFRYDYETREASWLDHGQRHTYRCRQTQP